MPRASKKTASKKQTTPPPLRSSSSYSSMDTSRTQDGPWLGGKSARQPTPKTAKPTPTPTPKTQPKGHLRAGPHDPIVISKVHIDKVVAALTFDDVRKAEVDQVRDRANGLLKVRGDDERPLLQRGTTKGEGFSHVFIYRMPSGATGSLKLGPTGINAKQAIQLTVNPAHMDYPSDYKALVNMLRQVLGPEADVLRKRFNLYRLDLCVDVEGAHVQDLLVRFSGARSHTVIFVLTDQSGVPQTYYLGSRESKRRAIVYDQDASDAAKADYGEKVSDRPKIEDDAEIVIKNKKTEGRTRFEVRQEFSDGLSFAELPKLGAALDEFTIYDVGTIRPADQDVEFLAYLDSVRFRGVAGARNHLAKTKIMKGVVNALEKRLGGYLALWASVAAAPAHASAAEEIDPVLQLFLPKAEYQALKAARQPQRR